MSTPVKKGKRARVKYRPTRHGYDQSCNLQSSKYPCTYYVKRFTEEREFQIVNASRGTIVYDSRIKHKINNYVCLMRTIKKVLAGKFGIDFDIEVRDRDYFHKPIEEGEEDDRQE